MAPSPLKPAATRALAPSTLPVKSEVVNAVAAVMACRRERVCSIGMRVPPFRRADTVGNRLFFRSDSQRLHLAIEIAPLEPEQFGGPRHVAVGFFELLQDVLPLGGFADFLQAAEAVQGTIVLPRGGERNVAGVDAHLRVQNDDALDQVF